MFVQLTRIRKKVIKWPNLLGVENLTPAVPYLTVLVTPKLNGPSLSALGRLSKKKLPRGIGWNARARSRRKEADVRTVLYCTVL